MPQSMHHGATDDTSHRTLNLDAAAPEPLSIRALLLGERIDHRRLAVAPGGIIDPIQLARPDGLLVFAFRWGAVVMVGGTREQEIKLIADLQELLSHPLTQPVDEMARIQSGALEDGVDVGGLVRLKDFSVPRLAVVADALAKSVALSHQETTMTQTLDGIEPVVTGLRGQGRMSVSSRAILRLVGSALAARNRSAARVQSDDKPRILWNHPELEGLHLRLAEEFELTDRSAALDRKLALIGETVQTLLAMIETRRSRTLEIAIVVFIGIELLTALYALIYK